MSKHFQKLLVLAFFEESTATSVLDHLHEGPFTSARGCTVGLLSRDPHGDVVATMLGPRADKDGAAVGAVLGRIALVLVGGTMPERHHLLDRDSDLTTDDIARIGAELDARTAVIAVLGPPGVVEPVLVDLTRMGGKTEIHGITRAGLERILDGPSLAV